MNSETKRYSLITMAIFAATFSIFTSEFGKKGQVGGITVEASPKFPLALDRQSSLKPKAETVSELAVSARSVLVKDPDSGQILYEKGADTPTPIASLTKLMTALLVEKNLSFETKIKVKEGDLEVEPFRVGLVEAEKLSVLDLLRAMLISSANDATMTLAGAASENVTSFVGSMNREAVSLGMKKTFYRNPVGFDEDGQFSTARDLGKLVEELLTHPELRQIFSTKTATIFSVDKKERHYLTNTNKLLFSHDEVKGVKTGFTEEAKGNLIILVDAPPVKYYFIILGSDNREADGEKIIAWVKENWTWGN